MAVILGTAGHIDHGKTSLIYALTGMDCDRLTEEKKRGITIELGFAWIDLQGTRVAIIDVPGHERFVRTMVAGASGIDLVLLVVSCEEGVMPQTREHLDICTLLGIEHGLVALTKIDLVDQEMQSLVFEEVAAFVKGTFLENAPIIGCSAATGQGLEELKSALAATIKDLSRPHATDIFCLPIDRIMTMRGFGTVVAGTIRSGSVSVGEELVVLPKGLPTKVRGLERHGHTEEHLSQGSRCALNVQGLEKKDLSRGDMLAHPHTLFPSTRWLVSLTNLPSSHALKNRGEVHLHHATKACMARLRLFQTTALAKGCTCLCEVLLPEPLCAIFGDRLVIRAGSPLRTLAGARILCPIPPLPPSKDRNAWYARWQELERFFFCKTPKERSTFLKRLFSLMHAPLTCAQLKVLTNLPTDELKQTLALLSKQEEIFCFDLETSSYVGKELGATLVARLIARAEALHAMAPLEAGFSKEALFGKGFDGFAPKLLQKILELALAQKKLVAEKEGFRLPGHSVLACEREGSNELLALFQKAGLTPPNLQEALSQVHLTEKEALPLLKVLVAQNKLVRIKEGLFFATEAFAVIEQKVRDWFQSHETLDVADLKSILGLSRKYLIAILEYMDNSRITVRVGDKRFLRKTL